MSTDCWARLGIEPSLDEREIKRAYARLLKALRPEEDVGAFQALREAFEEALCRSDELNQASQQMLAEAPDEQRQPLEIQAEQQLRPHIEQLAELNERGTSEAAMQALDELLTRFAFRNEAGRDPLLWQLFEDGMLWVCCDIAANHDDFLRAAMQLFGWGEPGNWLTEKDPKTVEWLKLRLREADALEAVDRLLDLHEAGEETKAMQTLEKLIDDDMLINIDVRHLFEAELMVGLSEFEVFPKQLARQAAALFLWEKDHRHLNDYNPDAWQKLYGRLSLPV